MTYPYAGNGNHQQFMQLSLHDMEKKRIRSPERFKSYKNRAEFVNLILEKDLSQQNDAMPIDLTKPRTETDEVERRIKKITPALAPATSTYAGTAGLLSSLMSITEKVPAINSPMPLTPGHEFPMLTLLDSKTVTMAKNNNDMETYLTETAMLNSKIKQSQMHRVRKSSIDVMLETKPIKLCGKKVKKQVCTARPINIKPSVCLKSEEMDKASELEACDNADKPDVELEPSRDEVLASATANRNVITVTNMETETIIQIEIPIVQPEQKQADDLANISGMDTLAEIAASSVKLDTTKRVTQTPPPPPPLPPAASTVLIQKAQSPPIQSQKTQENDSNEPQSVPANSSTVGNSAKNVASEYVKKSSIEYMRAVQDSSSDIDTADSHSSRKLSQSSVIALQKIAERGSSTSIGGSLISGRTVVVGEDGFKSRSGNSKDLPVVTFPLGKAGNSGTARPPFIQEDGGRCAICKKTFLKKSQMDLHMNVHFVNPQKFRCEPCAVNFRSPGHLQKHERSETHKTKLMMTTTFGQVSERNPRPFECSDCKIAFRIHGHLAKHLRSKTHVQKLECLQKLPFGTYAEIERAGISLTDIDTSDCDNSLASLRILAQKLLLDKDSSDDKSNSAMSRNNFSPADGERERTGSTSEDGEVMTGDDISLENTKNDASSSSELKNVDSNAENKNNECSSNKFQDDSDDDD